MPAFSQNGRIGTRTSHEVAHYHSPWRQPWGNLSIQRPPPLNPCRLPNPTGPNPLSPFLTFALSHFLTFSLSHFPTLVN